MKLYRLEAVRGAAAFYLLLHHTLPQDIGLAGINVRYVLGWGQEALMVFLLLSGFVIHYSWSLASDRRLLAYLLKRCTRLFVPLLAVLPLAWLVYSWQQGEWVVPALGEGFGWSLACLGGCYLLYYPLEKWVTDSGWRNVLVFGVALMATLAYTLEPVYGLRLLMSFAIWWSGAWLAEIWLVRQQIGFRDALPAMIGLGGVVVILWLDVLEWQQQGNALVMDASPVLEMRHAGFALLVILLAIGWGKGQWLGFDWLLWPFIVFAPIAYALYLSPVLLVQAATWLSFLHNPWLEWGGYLLTLMLFAWWLERRFYPAVRRWVFKWCLPARQAGVFRFRE